MPNRARPAIAGVSFTFGANAAGSSEAHEEDLEEDRLELTCYRLRGRRDCRDDEHEKARLPERLLGRAAEHCKVAQ